MKRWEIPITLGLVVTGVALVAMGLWVWADHPLWLRVLMIVAGSLNLLRVTASLWIRRYAQGS
jgi:ABC-type uncharacterized transport system permease subunit